MGYWQYLLGFAAGAVLVLAWICSIRKKQKAFRRQEFIRKLDSLLQPKEKILVVCPQKGGYCVLTNVRLLFCKKEEITAFPLRDIRSIQGKNRDGNRTTIPDNMVGILVKTNKDFFIQNTNDQFLELAKRLQTEFQKRNAQKSHKK